MHLGRLRALGAGVLGAALLLVIAIVDAAARRAADEQVRPARVMLVRSIGLPDLVLSSGSRWLRHPSQVELGAPFADQPACFDVDPAGALIGPGREARP